MNESRGCLRPAAGIPRRRLPLSFFAIAFLLFAALPARAGVVATSPDMLDFGGQSMGTTSPPLTVTLTNTSAETVKLGPFIWPPAFAAASSNACATLGPGASCDLRVVFRPRTEGTITGTLWFFYGPGTTTLYMRGVGERSLVTHYYRSILGRDPDGAGKAYWESEAARLAQIGADPNETSFAMAMTFYASAEYAGFGRDDGGYVTDLYRSFFDRAPDADGFAYWTGTLAAGMPREVVLSSFMFSPESASFSRSIFGASSARAEVEVVVDFYRGILGRLPDDAGSAAWMAALRTAQCQGPQAVVEAADRISGAFVNSHEYLARGRSNAQYVGDLYNAFLRRGGEIGGVLGWIGQLDNGNLAREDVRRAFLASAEFAARVHSMADAGCLDQQQSAIDPTANGMWIGGLEGEGQKLAQVVTAGQTGMLTRVNLPVTCAAGGDLTLEIHSVTGGVPNGIVLSSQLFTHEQLPPFWPSPTYLRGLKIATPVYLRAGSEFAIVLKAAGRCSIEQGPVGDSYAGGNLYFDSPPNTPGWLCVCAFTGGHSDLPFQTIMAPTP